MAFINPEEMIEEVQKRPGLWKADVPVDRLEKLTLWKEIGALLYKDWPTINKATAYDRVLQLQKRWRSYKDAYNRELRRRRNNSNHRVYVYFNRLKFLGGHDGLPEPPQARDELDDGDVADGPQDPQSDEEDHEEKETTDPLTQKEKRKRKKQKTTKRRHRMSYDFDDTEQVDAPTFTLEVPPPPVEDDDSDKLFLLSFVPEMKKLHPNIKMWVRSQIANVMQEAVRSHFSNSMPNTGFAQEATLPIKRQRESSTDY